MLGIQDYAWGGDVQGFNRLKNMIFNPDAILSPTGPRLGSRMTPVVSSPRPAANGNGRSIGSASQNPPGSFTPIPAMTSHRHSATTHLQFTPPDIEKLASDRMIRVMVYCAVETALTSYTKADIAFPHQVELKVNNDEVKANLRGLKNKPGSTRPADITDLVHRKPKYENTITLTYALTQKKFSFLVNLVKVHQVEELVSKLKRGKSITREQAIKEIHERITTTNLGRYVNDILQSTPKSVDQVTIEPDGKWSQNTLPISPGQTDGSNFQNGNDDDDIIEIQDMRLTSLKSEYTSTPTSGPRTPSINSREPSTSRSSNSKRPVIDLTLSDDDEEPPRPAKRTMTSGALTNVLARRNGYRTHTSGLPRDHQTPNSSRLNGLSFQMPPGSSRSNPSSIGTPDR
ncbi:hypothetical protein FGG08_004678 [Glutinoglossum americanum]|uniref:PINIT domain-containing protein n=1 Tax=Glutinoglossum americanum TaxID=1670608 RepID=A0A9P8L284_9PEZI|nr:hypothetical protein FGG08_004678 [Glutinoglossum americanum]